MDNPDLQARLVELIQPTPTEIRRAKRAVMRVLDDGAVHGTPTLVTAAAEDLGAVPLCQFELRFLAGPIDARRVPPDEPSVLLVRARLAGQWAVADLAVRGCIIPAIAREGEAAEEPLRGSVVTFTQVTPHGSSGVRIPVLRPDLASAYVRSPTAASELKWFLDPDVFLGDLSGLPLDEHAVRTLHEALESFRRGLYLASAALLGVVSEAAWYAAAAKLGKPGSAVERAVTDGATAKVQKGVADLLRGVASVGTSVDEVYAFASFFRELRNYGVHPALVRDDIARFFAEEECGLLVLRTHNYLVRLAQMVEKAGQERLHSD